MIELTTPIDKSDLAAAIDRGPPRPGADVIERLGLLGFLGIFGLVRARRSDAIDLAVTMKLQGWSQPWLGRLMAAVSWPGFPPQSRIVLERSWPFSSSRGYRSRPSR